MMFCDACDRGYHTFCIGLTRIPSGRWECKKCTKGDGGNGRKGKTPSIKDESSGTSPSPKVLDPNAPPVKRLVLCL